MNRNIYYLPQIVGRGYGKFWYDTKRYRVLKGGKGSKKSATTALNYIYRIMKYPESNLLVVRAVFSTHRDSTFAQLKWAQEKLGVAHLWQNTISPMEMVYKPTGQRILFKVTAERLKYDDKKDRMLKNAYISGTGILYTYWDSSIRTGLYADEGRQMAITGDIACEVLDIENIVFGDPNNEDVESQPYIIIARRMDVEAVRREAVEYGQPIENIVPDCQNGYFRNAGDRGEDEPTYSQRVTVVTKLYKKYDKEGKFTIWGKTVTEKAVVRPEWD